jgi:hypothetical protein
LFISGIFGFKTSVPVAIIILFASLVLIIYYFFTLRIRLQLNDYIEQEEKAEVTLEIEGNKINQNFTKNKGKILELMIYNKLIELFPNAKIYKNIKVPKMYGEDTEIDVLMIDQTGIYIFEAKNHSGTITGNWSEDKLTIRYKSGQEYVFDNPILQNSNHYKYLQSISSLKPYYFHNIVVLGQSTYYQKEDLKTLPSYGNVTTIYNIEKTIAYIQKKKNIVISQSDQDSISQMIKEIY